MAVKALSQLEKQYDLPCLDVYKTLWPETLYIYCRERKKTMLLVGAGELTKVILLSAGSFGILVGLLYLSTKRNLWNCVIAHGLNDTIAFFFLFVTP